MDNPYTPPASASVVPARIALYAPGHVALATFLGAPIAGCVLLALNYRRLGDSKAANLALFAGFMGTGVLLAIAFVLPDRFSNSVLPAASTFGMYQCAKTLQGKAHEHWLANGGIQGSGWTAAGIGILCLIGIVIAIIAVILVAPEAWFS